MFTCHYGQAVMERTLHATSKILEVQGQLELAVDYPELEAVVATHGYLREIKGEITGNKLLLSGTVDLHLVYRGKESVDRVPVYGMVWKGTEGVIVNGEVDLSDLAANWDWQVRLLKTKCNRGRPNAKIPFGIEVRLRAHEPVAVDYVDQIETETPIHTEVEHLLVAEPFANLC